MMNNAHCALLTPASSCAMKNCRPGSFLETRLMYMIPMVRVGMARTRVSTTLIKIRCCSLAWIFRDRSSMVGG